MSKVQDIRHKRSRHWCGMPRIGNSIGLGSCFPGPRWRRLLGMTSDWTGHRLLPWRRVLTLSAAIVTSYNMDGLPHRLVIYRELQANCKCLPMSIPCPSAQLYPFKCWYCPFFMPGIGHTCRDPGIRHSYPSISGQGMVTSNPDEQHLGMFWWNE